MKETYSSILKKMQNLADSKTAEHSLRFFKAGKGEYGEGDQMLGIRVPVVRKLAKEYRNINQEVRKTLIRSKWHEVRLLGLIILVENYQQLKKKDPRSATKLYKEYISSYQFINNWDLVDATCHKIMGPELEDKKRDLLYTWARSKDLWKKRMAMMTNYYFIRRNDLDDCYAIAKILLHDEHDLIHKVVGWMLREAGKKDKGKLDDFLTKYAATMPRTMLRYALEKHSEAQRKKFMKK